MENGFGGSGSSQGFGNPGGLSSGQLVSDLLTLASAYLRENSPTGFDLGGGESPIPIPILRGMVGGFLQSARSRGAANFHRSWTMVAS